MPVLSDGGAACKYMLWVWESQPNEQLVVVWDEGSGMWSVGRAPVTDGQRGPRRSAWQVEVWRGNAAKFREDVKDWLGVLMDGLKKKVMEGVK